MATRKPTTRKRTTARRRKAVTRARRPRVPRNGPLHARFTAWALIRAVDHLDLHKDGVRSRKDAAILRATHQGCTTCGGNGQIFTKRKDGSFSGSKPCPATPTKARVSKWAVYKASRFGAEKRSGLVGCSCPCGWKQKPRFRDAKEATKALRGHEKQKHGGKTVGGTWYAQVAKPTAGTATKSTPAAAPVTKTNTSKAMSDTAWEKQNKPPSPAKATRLGLCRWCTDGALYSAFGGEQRTVVCGICNGTGKAKTDARAAN
ncbi:hypothetical protein SMD44_00940 [Streptomyces alboflavus]|uniref:Uncharacterized protein n=1 Tax=Streptomyces alboflavus TaxID=67267 RepID=A0A1Z1W574_9ACTN|nr:hypothetical protein [Streptomyces alboflavus]ARX81542.1 hypothetical protein SMD44_00940 [Streptomyces alboflavus]